MIPEQPDKQDFQYDLAQYERRIHGHSRAELLGTHPQILMIYVENEIVQIIQNEYRLKNAVFIALSPFDR